MVVVSDTSVLLNLARIGHEDLLLLLYRRILAPPIVRAEFERLAAQKPRFSGVKWLEWVIVQQPLGRPLGLPEGKQLDAGELAAMALAQEVHADLLLIDEAAGRAAAVHAGLTIIGLAGVLLAAKSAGLIVSVKPLMERVMREGEFWVHEDFYVRICQLAGEL